MTRGSARAVAFVAALLSARALLDGGAGAPAVERAVPHGGPARLLYGAALDANREPAEVLALLPGIGPARGEAIVAARPLCSLADLDRVPGVGPVTLRTLGTALAFPALPHACEHSLGADRY